MFNKILVANRGGIACRAMRTARALGYRTVAVFSDADADAPQGLQADAAVHIGPPAAVESCLSIAALLAAARATGADAVHPGYGFLSERAAAIAAMGHQADAKRRMRAAGVPCAPARGHFLPAGRHTRRRQWHADRGPGPLRPAGRPGRGITGRSPRPAGPGHRLNRASRLRGTVTTG